MSKAKPTKTDEPVIDQVKILRAFKPGDIVFIETKKVLSIQNMQHMHRQLAAMLPEIKIVILQDGMRVAAREEHAFEDET